MKRLLYSLQVRVNTYSEWQLVMALFVLALTLRVLAGYLLPTELMPGAMSDRFQYQRLAVNLLETRVFGFVAGVPDLSLPPGYPFFLAAVYGLFDQTVDGLGVRLVQSLVGSLTVVIVYLLARRLAPAQLLIAVLAAVAMAVHPILIFFCQVQLTETLYTLMTTGALLVLVIAQEKDRWWITLLAGFLLGLTLLTREVLILFPVVITLGLLVTKISWNRYWRMVFLLFLGLLMALAPWFVRNTAVSGQLSLSLTGRAAYAVNKVTGEDIGSFSKLEQELDNAIQQNSLNAMRYANFRQMLNPTYILDNPRGYLWMLGARVEYVWLHPNGLESIPWMAGRVIYRLGHAGLLLLALLGIVEAIKYKRWLAWMPILLLAYAVGFHLFISTAAPRYSLPTMPLLLIFFANGLLWILPPIDNDEVSSNGVVLDGASLDGTSLDGTSLDGTSLDGTYVLER